jgi:hypothetical protein
VRNDSTNQKCTEQRVNAYLLRGESSKQLCHANDRQDVLSTPARGHFAAREPASSRPGYGEDNHDEARRERQSEEHTVRFRADHGHHEGKKTPDGDVVNGCASQG